MPWENLTDQALLEASIQGKAEAVEALIQRYYAKVQSLCRRYIRALDESNDLAQEVFIKVFVEKKLANFRQEAHLWSWLYRITINTCLSHLRRSKRRLERVGLIDHDQYPEQVTSTVLAVLEEEELLHARWSWIRIHLPRIPPRYQQAIQLVYLEGSSHGQAASRLGISARNLAVRLVRGKKILAALAKKCPPGLQHLRRKNQDQPGVHFYRRVWYDAQAVQAHGGNPGDQGVYV